MKDEDKIRKIIKEVILEERAKSQKTNIDETKFNGGFPTITDENDLIKLIVKMARKSKSFAKKVSKVMEPYGKRK